MTTDAQHPTESASAELAVPPYSQGKRAFYGLTWTFWTVALMIGAFTLFGAEKTGQGLLALAASGGAGYYAYRIWTWQARRLIFFFII